VNMQHANQDMAVLQEIWSGLCRREVADVDLNFFDAGGYSLLLMDLTRQIQARFAVRVGVLQLFRHPTIRSQAKLIQSLRPA
jgi:aryl carrier-like protein